ncbi:MAG: SDR family NAD(P)-dependent oxidoreductase [Smithellaceae bacterium]|nr:SDR family NAD(P)-dependent oxidoreductase [Smithellaceae bacterium]
MKKAIVIGASSGIGRELAKILAGKGYRVGVMARRVDLLNSIRNEIKGELLVQKVDAMDTETAMGILSSFIKEMNGVDLIVISAGTGDVNDNLNWSIEHDTIRTNVTGFSAFANVAIQHFIEKRAGHLVGISSIASLRGGRESPAYNASKAFESNYMEALRQKITWLRLPIIVTDIKPGFVKTGMAKGEGIFWAAPADKAAMQIYNVIKRKKTHAYITHRWRFIAWLLKVIPARIYERL